MSRMRLFALLATALVLGAAVAPTAAAQISYIPPCTTLCLLIVVLVQTFGQCANAEVQQTVYDVGDGCVFTNAAQHAADCIVRLVGSQAGLAEACPP